MNLVWQWGCYVHDSTDSSVTHTVFVKRALYWIPEKQKRNKKTIQRGHPLTRKKTTPPCPFRVRFFFTMSETTRYRLTGNQTNQESVEKQQKKKKKKNRSELAVHAGSAQQKTGVKKKGLERKVRKEM